MSARLPKSSAAYFPRHGGPVCAHASAIRSPAAGPSTRMIWFSSRVRPGSRPWGMVAITARGNYRSQAVMLRIGMVPEPWRDFDHPNLADDHPLKAHVTWSLKRP